MHLTSIVRGYLDGHTPLNTALTEALTIGFNRWEFRAELHKQHRAATDRFRAADDIIVSDQFITINHNELR